MGGLRVAKDLAEALERVSALLRGLEDGLRGLADCLVEVGGHKHVSATISKCCVCGETYVTIDAHLAGKEDPEHGVLSIVES